MLILITVLAFFLILSFIFITHELGHFLAAKKAGVPVLEFGLGFPPRLFKYKKGGTVYSINLIPFGAFVNILGLEEPQNKDPKAYWSQGPLKRLAIAASGVVSNFFWAWLLLTLCLWIYFFIPAKNFVLVEQTIPDSAAESVGIKQGDLIVGGDGQVFEKSEEVSQFTKSHQNQEVKITIRRFGKDIEKQIKLGSGEVPLGISMVDAASVEKVSLWKAPFVSAAVLGNAIYLSFLYLGKAIISVFTKTKVPFEVGGPVAVWGYVSQFASMGYLYLLRLTALLSLALGFFNLLPLPALDGGRIIFLILEKIFGKKVVRPETENIIHTAGFAFLIGLLVLITYKDILRLLGR